MTFESQVSTGKPINLQVQHPNRNFVMTASNIATTVEQPCRGVRLHRHFTTFSNHAGDGEPQNLRISHWWANLE
jgi:hypothetical protein